MSLEVTIDLEGLYAFTAALEAALEAAVEAEAKQLAEEAAAAAPVLTGALRDSIEAEPDDTPMHWIVHDGGNDHPEVDYGVHVNYGSQGRPANPFFSKAADAANDRFADRVTAAIRGATEGR